MHVPWFLSGGGHILHSPQGVMISTVSLHCFLVSILKDRKRSH